MGHGIKFIGWSGRGWPDGGPTGAGPLNSQAPSWDSYGQEIGINMVRLGFSMKLFLAGDKNDQHPMSEKIKKGFENREVSWAKSVHTSYSYSMQRCSDLGWKILVCINPSYRSPWSPFLIIQSSDSLRIWKEFCYTLARSIEKNWPGMADYFEIANEPDIGYFDGESFLPDYRGPSGGITPFQYSLLLQNAHKGIKEAVPHAKVIGPALASWNRYWIEELLDQSKSYLDGLSYHNVGGNLKDEEIMEEAKSLLSQHAPQAEGVIFNSEWAWWPNHDINSHETALRIAQILYLQTVGNAYGSLYLGPAQPNAFKKGLGVLQFHPDNPNAVKKTKTFFVFRLMARGVMGGKRLELINPFKKLRVFALLKDKKELVMTVINPSKKKFWNISIHVDDTFPLRRAPFVKLYQFDSNHSDSCEESDYKILERFNIEPESIIQFIISNSRYSS